MKFMQRQIFEQDHELFRQSFRSFLEKEIVPYQKQWEEAGIVPKEIWRRCGEQGFLVPSADEEFGGAGIKDFRFDAVMLEELAYANETGLLLGLHNSLVAPYILSYGSQAFKSRIVPKIVSGEAILAVAMTEPGAGSDLAGMKSTAVKQGGDWLLNGQKCFISNGINCDVVLVAARTDPENPHTMGIFAVESSFAGFERGAREKKMGLHAQDTATLYFKDVRVPKENVLGDPTQGFHYLMEKLVVERLTLCVSAIASCQAAIDQTTHYVKERQAFGKPLSKFQNTQFTLAELQTQTDISQVYVDRMIMDYNAGNLTPAAVCGGKFWITDLACKVMDECLQLHGGYGYTFDYPICKMFVDARVGRIYAGSNEIMKTVVARAMDL